jgi:hypothetical protein
MDELGCTDVQLWMREIVQPDKLILPTPALVAHVAGCPLCRGAFALLAAKAIDLPSLAGPITCRQCEEDLAAFIEHETEETSAAAIRTYPLVWWHLWTCEDCMETYRVTRSYLKVEQSQAWAGVMGAVSQPSKPSHPGPILQLPRQFLHLALASSFPAQGVTRSSTSPSYMLTEQERLDTYLKISVQRQGNGAWRVEVVHAPPPIGLLVLRFGTDRFRARFNHQGCAVVDDIPFALLTAPEGPPLEVDIERDADEAPEV